MKAIDLAVVVTVILIMVCLAGLYQCVSVCTPLCEQHSMVSKGTVGMPWEELVCVCQPAVYLKPLPKHTPGSPE